MTNINYRCFCALFLFSMPLKSNNTPLGTPISTPVSTPVKTPDSAARVFKALERSPFNRLNPGVEQSPNTCKKIDDLEAQAEKISTAEKRYPVFRRLFEEASKENCSSPNTSDMRTNEDDILGLVESPDEKKKRFNRLRKKAGVGRLIDLKHLRGKDPYSNGGGHLYDDKPDAIDAKTKAETGAFPFKDPSRKILLAHTITSPEKQKCGAQLPKKSKQSSMVYGMSLEDIDDEVSHAPLLAYKVDPVNGIRQELLQGRNGRCWEASIKPEDELVRPYPAVLVEEGLGTTIYGSFFPGFMLRQFADQEKANGKKSKYPGQDIIEIAPHVTGGKYQQGVLFRYK